eukprot:GHVT01098173.1.p1 GENE.GHVT01098173.1~~GHVT01098173.1.p1  ORF type:complete len:119 (+),score=4.97 GHVT01098173.1:392-748(+)
MGKWYGRAPKEHAFPANEICYLNHTDYKLTTTFIALFILGFVGGSPAFPPRANLGWKSVIQNTNNFTVRDNAIWEAGQIVLCPAFRGNVLSICSSLIIINAEKLLNFLPSQLNSSCCS